MKDYIKIDMATYNRAEHFALFHDCAYPYVGVTVDVDITDFIARVKAKGYPLFMSIMWCAAKAANSIPEFRRRLLDGEIIEFSSCVTNHTVARSDGTFGYCTLDPSMPFEEFLPVALAHQAEIAAGTGLGDMGDVLPQIFISTVTNIAFTGIVQPTPIPADSNPRITWGKYRLMEGKQMLPLSTLCNHALMDGYHLGLFYEAFEREIAVFGAEYKII